MSRATAWVTRSLRPPPGGITPNPNDPADVPPASVGPPAAVPGDPSGVVFDWDPGPPAAPPPTIRPSAWSGWPGDWATPNWGGASQGLTDTAWVCVDLNASILASMPPYLVGAARTLDSDWLTNPDPTIYSSWQEFAKQLFWDFQLGEAFVLTTARYATGYPARFHVVPPWFVEVEMAAGTRRYAIGGLDVTADICHLRYQSRTTDARGHGPLESGWARIVAARMLQQYAVGAISGVAPSILEADDELDSQQSADLKAQWVASRLSALGEPAVLSGGVHWKPGQLSPAELTLVDLADRAESRIAVMLGVPPFLVGLPTGGDSMTYANVQALFDYHWRASLRPKSSAAMDGLSEFLLPRGTTVRVNADAYVQPGPLERAQTEKILVDMGAMTVEQVQAAENLNQPTTIGGPILG